MRARSRLLLTGALALVALPTATAMAAGAPLIGSFQSTKIGSVVASNGDQNPYGLAVVPLTKGNLVAGDVLVVDFNNHAGTAGAGTSVVEINPTTGVSQLFFQGTTANGVVGPVGIAINPVNDIVWLGDYGPANSAGIYDGASGNVTAVAPTGTVLATFDNTTTATADFNGVWGQAVSDVGGSVAFYWSNAGNGTTGTGGGSVYRLNPGGDPANTQPLHATYTLLAQGLDFSPIGSNAGTAIGPQGMAYDSTNGTLYVAEDGSNQIVAIPNAATATATVTATVVLAGGPLQSPQNIVVDPTTGNLIVANGATNNDVIELSTSGSVLATVDVSSTQAAGALFGLAATTINGQLVIYYGNDDDNNLYQLSAPAAVAAPTPTPAVPVPVTGAGVGGSPTGPLLILAGALAALAGIGLTFGTRQRSRGQVRH